MASCRVVNSAAKPCQASKVRLCAIEPTESRRRSQYYRNVVLIEVNYASGSMFSNAGRAGFMEGDYLEGLKGLRGFQASELSFR